MTASHLAIVRCVCFFNYNTFEKESLLLWFSSYCCKIIRCHFQNSCTRYHSFAVKLLQSFVSTPNCSIYLQVFFLTNQHTKNITILVAFIFKLFVNKDFADTVNNEIHFQRSIYVCLLLFNCCVLSEQKKKKKYHIERTILLWEHAFTANNDPNALNRAHRFWCVF